MTVPTTHVCSACGKEHPGLPTDWAFRLPDEVHALSYLEMYRRSRSNADLCCLDNQRYFLRGVLSLPFIDRDGAFVYGLWVEIDHATHDAYLQDFNADAIRLHQASGRLANDLQGYAPLRGAPVEIHFRQGGSRPELVSPTDWGHPLAAEQHRGIDSARHHALLESFGYFDQSH